MHTKHHVLEHFFRHEAGRLTASLVGILGVGRLELAQDIVQSTLLAAMEQWRYNNLPPNPEAWLRRVARNRAIDMLRHNAVVQRTKPMLALEHTASSPPEASLSGELTDAMLRLMFACCNPALTESDQVTLILNALCGFSASEIALAFLIKPATMERRLSRAKAKLRKEGLRHHEQTPALAPALPSVHRALYVLFSEGYHGGHPQHTVRHDLCAEALRLGELLTEHPDTNTPTTHALMALMCLLAARLNTRQTLAGDLLALREQDRRAWEPGLQRRGFAHLQQSADGEHVTSFHLQAAIAATHAAASSWEQTDWERIVTLYDTLTHHDDSAIVKLNRAIAIAQRDGPLSGLAALEQLHGGEFEAYPFWFAARAECHAVLGQLDDALRLFKEATLNARSAQERRFWQRRAEALCSGGMSHLSSKNIDLNREES